MPFKIRKDIEALLTLHSVSEYDEDGEIIADYWSAIALHNGTKGEGRSQTGPLHAIREALQDLDETLIPDYVRVVERKMHDLETGEV